MMCRADDELLPGAVPHHHDRPRHNRRPPRLQGLRYEEVSRKEIFKSIYFGTSVLFIFLLVGNYFRYLSIESIFSQLVPMF
jgi:hypothetical protein